MKLSAVSSQQSAVSGQRCDRQLGLEVGKGAGLELRWACLITLVI
jgi:hypothetical protein